MEILYRLTAFFEAVGQVVGGILLVAVLVGCVWLAWLGRVSRRRPASVSPPEGPLRADGDKPNWVSSTASTRDPLHFIAPRAVPANPIPDLEARLRAQGCTIVTLTDRYVHALCPSRRFRFVDDLELFYDAPAGLLHARSASRVGYSDLGVNRRRLETLFTEAGL